MKNCKIPATYEGIVKALECFALDKDWDFSYCVGCAFRTPGTCQENMSDGLANVCLDFVKRQQAEKEALIKGQETLLAKAVADREAKIKKLKVDLKYYLDNSEENGVVYIPKFIVEKRLKELMEVSK